MPDIYIPANGVTASWTTFEPGYSPLDSYNDWCTALGVSNSETLLEMEGNDSSWPLELGICAFPSFSQPWAFFASEGGIGLYDLTTPNGESLSYDLPDVSRFFGDYTIPPVVITWHGPDHDLRTVNAKVQRSGEVTIIFSDYHYYSYPETQRSQVAIWIEKGEFTVHFQPTDDQTTIYIWAMDVGEPTPENLEPQEVCTVEPGDSIIVYFSLSESATRYLAGTAKFTDGTVADQLFVLKASTCELMAEGAVDPETGEFDHRGIGPDDVYILITKPGYRPLVHGPVTPASEPYEGPG